MTDTTFSEETTTTTPEGSPAPSFRGTEEPSVVWPHYREGGNRDQLRYSVRSVAKWLEGAGNYVVCGDVPWWFMGVTIDQPRTTDQERRKRYGTDLYPKYADLILKLLRVIDDPRVTNDFLWMYDDTYLVGSLSVEQLAVPRAKGTLSEASLRFRRESSGATSRALLSRGLPEWNYSTRYPTFFNKQKLTEVIREFDPLRYPALIESLYANYAYPEEKDPKTTDGIFEYEANPSESWGPVATVVNVGSFNSAVQPQMEYRFGNTCKWERTAEMDWYRYLRTQ